MYSLSGRSNCVGNARIRDTIKVVVRVNKSPSSPVAIFTIFFNGNHISCHGCEFVITLLCSK